VSVNCVIYQEIPRFATNDKSKWRFLRPLRYRRNDNHLYIEPGDEGGGFAAAFIPLIYIKQCHPDARVFCGQRDLNFTFFVISLQAFGQMLKLGMTKSCVQEGGKKKCHSEPRRFCGVRNLLIIKNFDDIKDRL
jgi:hypothetical protein